MHPNFQIIDRSGAALAVFRLQVPEQRVEMKPDGSIVFVEQSESAYDEQSLEITIENLRRQGLDVAPFEAALAALREAVNAAGMDAPSPGAEAFAPAAVLSLGPVAEITHDIVVVTTAGPATTEPLIAYVNPAFNRLVGYTSTEAVGRHLGMLYGSGTSPRAAAALQSAMAAGWRTEEKLLLYPKLGRPLWFEVSVTPLLASADAGLVHSVVVGRYANHVGRGHYEFEDIARRDELTGLPDRQVLLEVFETQLRTPAGPCTHGPSVAFISIDHFSEIETRSGTRTSNAVLLGVADRLAQNVRRADVVYRLGGAEFVIYMAGIGLRDAQQGAERLRRVIADTPVETPRGALPVTISVGVAEANRHRQEAGAQAMLVSVLAAARGAARAPGHADNGGAKTDSSVPTA